MDHKLDGRPISLKELEYVKNVMTANKRSNGFLSVTPAGKVEFFDSEPSFGGAAITIEDINGAIKIALCAQAIKSLQQ